MLLAQTLEVPDAVAESAPVTYIVLAAFVLMLSTFGLMIASLIRGHRKRDDQFICFLNENRVAAEKLQQKCHETTERIVGVMDKRQEENIKALTGFAIQGERMEKGIEKLTAVAERWHGLLDRNGVTRPGREGK